MTPAKRPRASGESSIYKDDDGRWHGFVSMGKKENRRRDRRHVSGAKRTDVVAKVRAIEAKRDAGIVEAAGRTPTAAEWLDHWLDNIAARKVRARTLESYRSTVRLHLRPGVGHHRLDRLQPEHLERLYAHSPTRGSARRPSCAPTGCCRAPYGSPLSAARSPGTSPLWWTHRRSSAQ